MNCDNFIIHQKGEETVQSCKSKEIVDRLQTKQFLLGGPGEQGSDQSFCPAFQLHVRYEIIIQLGKA